MCNTNMKINFYYANIYKHEHEKEHDKVVMQDCA